jgi:hypothetical protein
VANRDNRPSTKDNLWLLRGARSYRAHAPRAVS